MKQICESQEIIRMNVHQTHQKALKAILFDMDNTLFDFVAVKLIACREILSYLGGGEDRDFKADPGGNFSVIFSGGRTGLKIMKT